MESKDIITLFLERKDRFGVVCLSVKQVAWLSGQLEREQKIDPSRGRHHPLTIEDSEGNYYKLAIYPNGAGFIKPFQSEEVSGDRDDNSEYLLGVVAKLRSEGNNIAANELEKAIQNQR